MEVKYFHYEAAFKSNNIKFLLIEEILFTANTKQEFALLRSKKMNNFKFLEFKILIMKNYF